MKLKFTKYDDNVNYPTVVVTPKDDEPFFVMESAGDIAFVEADVLLMEAETHLESNGEESFAEGHYQVKLPGSDYLQPCTLDARMDHGNAVLQIKSKPDNNLLFEYS